MVEESKKDQEPNEAAEEVVAKVSIFSRLKSLNLKKFLVPAASAAGAFAISAAIYFFILGGSFAFKQTMETPEAATSNTTAATNNLPDIKKHDSSTVDIKAEEAARKIAKEDVSKIEIDTAGIMKELDYLFITPDMENAELGMNPQDSLDTLSWIQKEMARFAEEKSEIGIKAKELELMKYKVDQGLLKIEQAESARIIQLARLYDGMKANEVARLFANLSDEVVVSILPRMKPANASKILALLPPKRAAELSTDMITVLEN
ncbi:MAG: hypothetical protein CVT49_03640 [candidate division Zixibacteria bacterium HGW-Zixibacteria-1]|nr:MAG: hypothetical protein CVT49_03640 [candidate division Zixibacteria bacterium HGW-Zixibacteria-1]